jgi:hypothetical protein
MPIIADHCLPTGWRGRSNPYSIVCAWPDDCYVQWGSHGVVLGKNGARVTAFFEAFPIHPKTYIRGEGPTVEAAERAAHKAFERYGSCRGHEFERGSYTNGGGLCKHCRMFVSDAFEPSTTCVVCGRPTAYGYGVDSAGLWHWYCEEDADKRPRDAQPSPVDRLDEVGQ